MSDLVNPFVPGQPVEQAALFVGRRDALAWARENLVKGRRVFVVYAPRRMGKTSFLLQISRELPPDTLAAYWSLEGEEHTSPEELIAKLASVVRTQLQERHGLAVPEPAWEEADREGAWLAEVFWPQAREALGHHSLLLLLDDLEALAAEGEARLASFVEVLARLREADRDLALLCAFEATDADQLARRYPSLFGGALFWGLGPLIGDDAVQVLTWPVGSALAYDYGVPRRMVELTSGHPHYLQLLGHAVFERCARQGWVNQRDLDLAVESLIQQELPEFAEVWESLDALERVALAAIASLRGGRGVATRQEIRTALERARLKANREEVQHALNRLVQRGILQQLGALSFRYRVDLFRLWLAQRFRLPDLVADARATRLSKRDRARRRRWGVLRTKPVLPVAEREDDEAAAAARPAGGRLRWWWALGAVPVAAGLIWLVASLANRPAALSTPTATPMAVATAISTSAGGELVASPRPEPTAAPPLAAPATRELLVTPSPTAPVVVAGELPAIAYQVNTRAANNWDVWLMNSDGSQRSQLTDDGADDTSPVWSPDGSKIAFVSYRDGNAEIYVTSTLGGEAINLTQHPAKDWNPAWSPDGEWIAFASLRDSLYWELYLMRADGSEVTRLTWWDDASDVEPTWGPDGQRLAFASKRDGNWELYVINRDGSGLARLTDHPADDTSPAWSLDGTRIAFESTRDGNVEIYVMPAAGGEAVNLSNAPFADDHGPSWSPDGHRLAFYSNRDREWDIYVMNDDGSEAARLTGDQTNDQVPAWRP
jgi:hypothetical protein